MGGGQADEAMAAEAELGADGIFWEELPAPPAWKKKVAQRRGGTPRRGDITFVAPDGEEIKTKRQLERYLKTNSGGPSLAEFDWSTGETPRRSERLSSRKRSWDVEAEATTPRRGRKKKNAATAAATTAEKSEEAAKEEEEPTSRAEKDGNGEAAAAAIVKEDDKLPLVKAPPAISCAKTETLTKSQEAQPAQIGVS